MTKTIITQEEALGILTTIIGEMKRYKANTVPRIKGELVNDFTEKYGQSCESLLRDFIKSIPEPMSLEEIEERISNDFMLSGLTKNYPDEVDEIVRNFIDLHMNYAQHLQQERDGVIRINEGLLKDLDERDKENEELKDTIKMYEKLLNGEDDGLDYEAMKNIDTSKWL